MKKAIRVTNVTRDTELASRGQLANTYWSRLVGLVGRTDLPAGEGLLIDPCSSVHCFFMSIPIDVLYLDKDNRVVAIDANLKPWRIGSLHRGVKRVLELPAGSAARSGTLVGDQLVVTPAD